MTECIYMIFTAWSERIEPVMEDSWIQRWPNQSVNAQKLKIQDWS
ncbi:hypothetical protein [Peribacillus simplex]